jgi:2-keto-3-deoxy-L-rhamnonate aldolase RhmA
MGPADLSNDIGCALDLAAPELQQAAERIGAAAARHGKTAALHLARADQAPAFRELGFTMFSSAFESAALVAAMTRSAEALRD